MNAEQIQQWIVILRSPGLVGKDYLDVMKSVMLTGMYLALTDSQKLDLLFLIIGMARSKS